jgi:DNA-binding transcriptional ArsR family regulator
LRATACAYILNHMVQYPSDLDRAFAALADPTRRGVLERLGRGDASITELAERFGMTLTGMKKHVSILEQAGLVATRKVGRVRTCSLGPARMDAMAAWMEMHRRMVAARLDSLGDFLERTKGDSL